MAQQRCASGEHVYDTEKHTSCPFCHSPANHKESSNQPHRRKAKGVTTVIVGGKKSLASPNNPAVGWLVIIKGYGQGNDLRIINGMNMIGRDKGEICLPFGDTSISREKHAFIAYDPGNNFFMINHGEGKNPLKVNNKMVMSSQELQPYDRITLGQTKLLFVPLCSKYFNWNDGYIDKSGNSQNETSKEFDKKKEKKQDSIKLDSSDDIGLFFK